MRTSQIYLVIGIISLVLVLGLTHVAMAYVSWSPTITPNYVTSIVSNLQASYTFSSPIGPTSSNPLYIYVPGNIYLGSYANGAYSSALNVTVTIRNPGTVSASATVYVSCPSPLGSASASVTVGAGSSASVTIPLRASLNGPVTSAGQFLQCSVYTSLSTSNVTAVSVQLPVEVTSYGIDFYGGAYHPAFTVQFYAPYFVFGSATYQPTLSIVPFAGLTMRSTLYLVQTGSSGSDTSVFQLPTPSSAGQTYSLEFIFVSLPATSPGGNYYYILTPFIPQQLLGGILTRVQIGTYYEAPAMPGIVINQQSGANWVTLYVSPGGISIAFSTTSVVPIYTNATTWYSYEGEEWSGGNWWFPYTIAIPVPPYHSERIWIMAFMTNSTIFGSNLPVPTLLMFNIVNVGYIVNRTLTVQVNGASNPLPPGIALSYNITSTGNYTWFNVTLVSPIGKIVSKVLITASYLYSPTPFTVLNNQYFGANYTIFAVYMAGIYGIAYSSNYYLLANSLLIDGSFIPNSNVTVFKATAISGPPVIGAKSYSSTAPIVIFGILPVVNITASATNPPVWKLGVSMRYVNVSVTPYENVIIVVPDKEGFNLVVPGVSLSGNSSDVFTVVPASAMGFRKYLEPHTIQYFINATNVLAKSSQTLLGYLVWCSFWAVMYPTFSSNVNTTIYELYPNGTSVILGHELVPVWVRTRVFNYTIATYYTSNTLVTDLILSMNQAPQVADVWYSEYIPGATVYTATYLPAVSPAPRVVTNSSGYVFMGYGVPYDVQYAFGSANQVYTNIAITKYGLGSTLFVTYPSVVGTVSYAFSIPSNASGDAILLFNDPVQPLSAVNVTSVSVTPTSQTVQAGSAVNMTVTIKLSAPVQVVQSFQGTISLNGTTVATFTITVPAGSSNASTTVMFVAPSKPGRYYGVVNVAGLTSTFILIVTPSYAVGTLVLIALALIIVALAVIIYRKKYGEEEVIIRI